MAARLSVGKSSEKKEKRKAHKEREEKMGHSLPAFDEARRVSYVEPRGMYSL
jgi:hypothetical protein